MPYILILFIILLAALFFTILPYRSKNPPEHFPYVTVALIVVNTVVWLATMENPFNIRREVVEQYAVSQTSA